MSMSKYLVATATALAAFGANAALTAGDIAIIARTNNGTPDVFSFVALSNISAGEVIYFTDNGWTGTGFYGSSATDGDGNENLTKWTAASAVSAGTIIASTSSGFTTSGSIAGTTAGSYQNLALNASGDQITAFQNSNINNPLFNTATQTALFAFDDTNGFENATTSATGGIATGLARGTTAVSVNFSTGGTIAIKSSVLATLGNDKTAWLAAISNTANWATATALPTGSISVASIVVTPSVPEPESYALMFTALGLFGLLARRRSV
jgi:hypothetical protein